MPTPLRRIHTLNKILTPVVDLLFACFLAGVVYFGVAGVFKLLEFLS